MSARQLALVCLLPVIATAADVEQTSGGKVQIYLRSDGSASPLILAEIKNELGSVMSGLRARVAWWTPSEGLGVDGLLIVADFRGSCAPPTDANRPTGGLKSLASTAVADGHILPFSSVDCSAVNAVLADSLLPIPATQRSRLYGRALARVLAHEIYHILTGNADHEKSGVAKAQFTAADLMSERFEFIDLTSPRQTRAEAVPSAGAYR